MKALIEEMATAYEDPSEVVAYYEQNEEMMNNMRNVALEEQAVDVIIEKAKVSDKRNKLQRANEPTTSIISRL